MQIVVISVQHGPHPNEGLHHQYLYTIAVDSENPDVVLVGATNGPRQAHAASHAQSTIYRKEGEKPWEEVTGGTSVC